MATPQQIEHIKATWETYPAREKENVDQIRSRMLAAGFSAEEINAVEVADAEGIT